MVSGELPPRKPSGLDWDADGSGPDPFVRLAIDGEVVWESPVLEDQTQPEWNVTLPRNLRIPRNSKFRLEVWDHDTDLDADPMGSIRRTGLPSNARPDATARLTLDNLAVVTVLVRSPRAHRGVGLRVEIRPSELEVLEVEPYSPAARANIRPGYLIVAVGEERISHLTDVEAISKLSLAAQRSHRLVVKESGEAPEQPLALDDQPVWLVLK